MKTKRVYLNKKKSKYCIVKLFRTNKEMQAYYLRVRPDEGHVKVLGVSLNYERWDIKTGKIKPETGTVLLSLEHCGAGVVTHELMHAVLWAYKHKKYKKQYPIVIKSMKEEEILLHRMSEATRQFYVWYWDVKTQIKKSPIKKIL